MGLKRKLILSVFFLTVTFLGVIIFSENVSAQNVCSDSNQTILRLSADTNAHGEVWNGAGNYPVEVCYDQIFGGLGDGNRTCNGLNKIIGLSSATNAHGEEPILTNYPVDICYGNVSCASRTTDCLAGELSVVNLSSSTNAHLAVDSSYSVNICCSVVGIVTPGVCALTSASWSVSEADEGDQVNLTVQGTDCDTEDVTFIIAEVDCIGSCDFSDNDASDTAKLTTGSVVGSFSGGQAIVSWIAEWHLDENNGLFGNDNPEYVFKAELISDPAINIDESGELEVDDIDLPLCNGIAICGNYLDSNSCNIDNCSVADVSNPTADCSDANIDCSCFWDAVNSTCEPDWSGTATDTGTGETFKVGSCVSQGQTTDTCEDDGFLSFSWTATWTWDSGNVGLDPPCQEGYVLDGGKCYNDPNGLSLECVDGQETVECPASIPLPFFGFYNVIAVLIMVSLIYMIMSSRKK